MRPLALGLLLALLPACRLTDRKGYEQTQFVATPPGARDELALGRIAVDPILRGPADELPRELHLRVYVENPGALPVYLVPESLRLVDAAERPLETLRVEPTPPATGFTIRPGRTRRFEAAFAFPAGGEPALAGFFLEWTIERRTDRASGRTRIVTEPADAERE
jgi:hypothetical protein